MSDDVKICNAAAVMLGAGVVQSLEDDTDLSRIFANLYAESKAALMSRYPWNFLKEDVYMTRRTGKPIRGWQYAYVIPAEALAGAPHAVFSYQSQKLGTAAFSIRQGSVLTNYPELWGTFIMNRREGEWPGYFRKLMVHVLAADVALAITDQQSIADRHYQMAYGSPGQEGIGGLMGEAMLLDSQSSGCDGFEADHFIAARRGTW